MTTFHEEHAESGMRSWSGKRWLVTAGILVAVAVAVVLILLTTGGGGHGGGGGY